MKKYLTLGLLSSLLLTSCSVDWNNTKQKDTLDLQLKCSQQATLWDSHREKIKNVRYTPIMNHYNQKYNTCFVSTETYSSGTGGTWSQIIYDILENKEVWLANDYESDPGKTKISCQISNKSCSSLDDWRWFIKEIME